MKRAAVVREAERARDIRTGELPHDVAVFARLLRRLGAGVGPLHSLQALAAVKSVGVSNRRDFHAALRCTLSGSPSETVLFDIAFDSYWSDVDAAPVQPMSGGDGDRASDGGGSRELAPPAPSGASSGPSGPKAAAVARRAIHSHQPGHARMVDATVDARVEAAARQLAHALGAARGRRWRPDPAGAAVDLRASLRKNLMFGAELLDLQRVARRRRNPRMLILCDVSASMQPVTPLFLSFTHALVRAARNIDAAVFNVTPLVVSDVFRRSDLRRSLAWLATREAALDGGTRIGHSLALFLDDAERSGAVQPGTVAVILSDGWDVGEQDLLRRQMRRLRSAASAIVWCDPHAATTSYQPKVTGLQAALDFCDRYVDFSSADSLGPLVASIQEVLRSRRAR